MDFKAANKFLGIVCNISKSTRFLNNRRNGVIDLPNKSISKILPKILINTHFYLTKRILFLDHIIAKIVFVSCAEKNQNKS